MDKGNRSSETSQDPSTPFRSQLGPLVVLAIIFYLNFVSRIILAPLLPNIEQDLNITHGEAGAFFLMISLGYFPNDLPLKKRLRLKSDLNTGAGVNMLTNI